MLLNMALAYGTKSLLRNEATGRPSARADRGAKRRVRQPSHPGLQLVSSPGEVKRSMLRMIGGAKAGPIAATHLPSSGVLRAGRDRRRVGGSRRA